MIALTIKLSFCFISYNVCDYLCNFFKIFLSIILNWDALNFSDKPNISSDVDQRTITAPGLLDLTFIVDSFPSSNVTIFHETKRLTLIPNVNGQLSFNVLIESCLDRGKYRVEAVNDVGSDSFTFIADVKCKFRFWLLKKWVSSLLYKKYSVFTCDNKIIHI